MKRSTALLPWENHPEQRLENFLRRRHRLPRRHTVTTLPVRLCLIERLRSAKLYELVYTVKDPYVLGLHRRIPAMSDRSSNTQLRMNSVLHTARRSN